MSEIRRSVILYWACDATGCTAQIQADAALEENSWRASDELAVRAHSHGWTRWASRGLRHYCPDHGPRPGHSMRPCPPSPYVVAPDALTAPDEAGTT